MSMLDLKITCSYKAVNMGRSYKKYVEYVKYVEACYFTVWCNLVKIIYGEK